jgi:hypothetical protein
MKTSKIQILTLALVTAFALGSPLSLSAEEKKAEKPAAKEPVAEKVAKVVPLPFHGKISAVDAKAKTFSIAGKKATRVFAVTDQTKITKDGAAAKFEDLAADQEVSGSYSKEGDKLTANSVKIGGPGEKPAKKAEKAAPAEKK